MAVEPGRVARFGRTERALHWVHAAAFGVMFATGLVLYVPDLSRIFSDRPVVKDIHLVTAIAWVAALLLVALAGDRRALRRTWRDVERLDAGDVAWLRRRGERSAGRFNAGQKLHTVVQAALTVLFFVSGVLLYLGERDHALRLPGTLALHDVLTLGAGALVFGHVAIGTSQHGAIDAITRGTVTEEYARHHHPRWRR